MSSSNPDPKADPSLSLLLDVLIPADPARGLPGGSVAQLRLETWIREGMIVVEKASLDQHGKNFNALLPAECLALVEGLKRTLRVFFNRLAKHLAESYYLSPVVAQVLGIRESPPFPDGYRVDEGDLTLLEPVYLRGRIFREV